MRIHTTIRVAGSAVDGLLERFESIGIVRELLGARSTAAREKARRLRATRRELAEALRLIGPPRPWGAPGHNPCAHAWNALDEC